MKRSIYEILVALAMLSIFIVMAFASVAVITAAYLFITGQL